MVRSFRHKGLRDYWPKGNTKGINTQWVARIADRLSALSVARMPEDMNLPGLQFHTLQGVDRYTVRVTGNYRLTFGWDGDDAIDVDLEDYH